MNIKASWAKELEFSIKSTRFRITRMLPMDGFAVLEDIRQSIGENIQLIRESSSVTTALATVVMAIKPNDLERIRHKLFAEVSFQNEIAKTWRPLYPDEAMGFNGLEAIHVYEVLGRCLAVNFFDSSQGIARAFQDMTQDTPSPNTVM